MNTAFLVATDHQQTPQGQPGHATQQSIIINPSFNEDNQQPRLRLHFPTTSSPTTNTPALPAHVLGHRSYKYINTCKSATDSCPSPIMSVKLSEKITETTTTAAAGAVADKSDILHEVGNALTKGAGPNGYLAVCFLA